MFWWLSFIRPPLSDAHGGQSVDVIIQITNDLRTELYPEPIDLYAVWTSLSFETATDPAKITTWRPEYPHKLVSLPCPRVSSPLSTWLLGLFACPIGTPPVPSRMSVNLTDSQAMRQIIPVYSAPISVYASTTPKAPGRKRGPSASTRKLDEIQRVFKLPPWFSGGPERIMRFTEKTSFDLDKKLWDSGLATALFFSRLRDQTHVYPAPFKDTIQDILDMLWTRRKECNVLELGTGTGIVSIALSLLLSQKSSENEDDSGATAHSDPLPILRIHATDLPSALPLIGRNIDGNCHLREESEQDSPLVVIPTAGVLDWEDETLPEDVVSNPPDLILMSDVTYNTSSFPALLKTLNNLLDLSPHARIMLAYKERHDSERVVWPMFEEQVGLQIHKVDNVPGAGGAPVEIWLGRRHRKQ